MPNTFLIKNPNAVYFLGFKDLLQRAFAVSPWKDIDITDEIKSIITNPRMGLLGTKENNQFVGLSIISLPTSKLDTCPQVIYLYNEGTMQAKDNLIKATVDFIHKAGYNRFWAINYSGRSDAAWSKVMKPEDWDLSPVGSIMEFKRNG